MTSQQPPVGIDLGTTYSVVAYIDDAGRSVCIPNEWGEVLTPSAVFVDEDEILVGKEAVKTAVMNPDAYAECFKRDMGSVAFRRPVCDQKVPPEILSALVLDRLRRDAQRRVGAFRKVVITVPAFFDENRRRVTQEAGRIAGLEVIDIINEPTAAAIAYGCDRGSPGAARAGEPGKPQRLLVYDLGGGTFDVTVLEQDGDRFQTLATDGDVRLGGKDFDERLVNHVAQQFVDAHGVDPRSDPQDAAQLWMDAQDAKHALSERTKTTVVCVHAGIRARIEVTRGEFEEMTADLVERTETTVSLVLRQAGLSWDQIDRLLLVGGATRMPMIRRMLSRLSGKEADASASPDEAVARGAALYAGALLGGGSGSGRPALELVNVNSHSLGVVGLNTKMGSRTNVILIPKNTSLPASASKTFKTAQAGQRSIRVPVVEGESDRPEDCVALGECVVQDLPPGLPCGTKVNVAYYYGANGRISVTASVPRVRYSAHVEIERAQARILEGLDAWRARLLGKRAVEKDGADGSAGAATVDFESRESVLRRLDALYTRVGRAAMRGPVPDSLASVRQFAVAAAQQLSHTQAAAEQAEAAHPASLHDPAAFHQAAGIARAKTAHEEAKVRADLTCLVLGRESVDNAFAPPGVEKELEEIRELRKHLERSA